MIPPVVSGGLVAAALAIFCTLIAVAVVIAVTVSRRGRELETLYPSDL